MDQASQAVPPVALREARIDHLGLAPGEPLAAVQRSG
jgi:hypothetical protein